MTSKRTDHSPIKNPNPNPNSSLPKKRNPKPNSSQSPQKKPKKKKKSRSTTESSNPNPSSPPSSPRKEMSSGPESNSAKRRKTDDDDAITILEKVIAFQSSTGANPTPTNMRPLFELLKDELRADLAGPDQLYNRIRHLRQKYYRLLEAGGGAAISSPYERAFFDLSVSAWGEDYRRRPASANGGGSTLKRQKLMPPALPAPEKAVENNDNANNNHNDNGNGGDEEMEDAPEATTGGESYKFLEHQAREYWAMAGLSADTLELGLKSMDPAKARTLEKKWAQHMEATLKAQAKEFELGKELYVALLAAQKNSN